MTNVAPVSVIIPCWRCADTIEQAVASVAAQTLRPRELILVDDASGDETYSVLCDLADEYEPHWIKVLTLEKGGGPGWARNTAWELAAEPYLAFLDVDDAWLPDKLERQMAWMYAHPQVLMTGHLMGQPHLTAEITAKPVSLLSMLIANRFATSSVILRKDIPFRFATGKYAVDHQLWFDLLAAGADCRLLNAVMGRHFARPRTSQLGELLTLERLRSKGKITFWLWLLASLWSLTKFIGHGIKTYSASTK